MCYIKCLLGGYNAHVSIVEMSKHSEEMGIFHWYVALNGCCWCFIFLFRFFTTKAKSIVSPKWLKLFKLKWAFGAHKNPWQTVFCTPCYPPTTSHILNTFYVRFHCCLFAAIRFFLYILLLCRFSFAFSFVRWISAPTNWTPK